MELLKESGSVKLQPITRLITRLHNHVRIISGSNPIGPPEAAINQVAVRRMSVLEVATMTRLVPSKFCYAQYV